MGRRLEARRTNYPMLPQILDEGTLAAIATLEPDEISFATSKGPEEHQYLRALYLKAMAHLGHAHFQPGGLPRQLRASIAEQLGFDAALLRNREIHRTRKSRIVADVRQFLGIRPATGEDKSAVKAWLVETLAPREGDLVVLINAAIERFRTSRVEIPSFAGIGLLAQSALDGADRAVLQLINGGLTSGDGLRLDELLVGADGKTPFDRLKEPAPKATSVTLAAELERLANLASFLPRENPLAPVSRRRGAHLASLARRYTAAELKQLRRPRRRAMLLSYLAHRHAQQLDTVVDLYIRVWENAKHNSTRYADEKARALTEESDRRTPIFKQLVDIIRASKTHEELWHSVHTFKTDNEYDALSVELGAVETWSGYFLQKLQDHYGTLRKFLPLWYELVPVCSTTTDDTLPAAHRFAGRYVDSGETQLPVDNCPTGFLKPPWDSKAIGRFKRTRKVTSVWKAPYELGLVEATVAGLKQGTIAVTGARRYAPMTEHLLDREDFLSNYDDHLARLGHPAEAADHYDPLRRRLKQGLEEFNTKYGQLEKIFWVNRDGTLGFSRLPGRGVPRRVTRIRNDLGRCLPPASVLEVLLDCHRWTGFLDFFRPITGRQNMSEKDRLLNLLAALYAYGCNCGPTQAAKALQLWKPQVVYMRRRFMPVGNLMAAAYRLAWAYQQTRMASRLGDANILMTDSMQVRTLKESLIAREHHRYLGGKSTLLYQHVTANCVCVFTQALLCNVSEALHMLVGALEYRGGREPIINVCDSAGKSDLVFGLATLLNIHLYPRVRSGNLKLWSHDNGKAYGNIARGFAGRIRWSRIDEGWRDMMWILASIHAGTAEPILILDRLAAQTARPATQGFMELGKLARSAYVLDYGMDPGLRRFVVPYTARREHWNKFTREVQTFGDVIREKTLDDQTEVFWFLTVVQNAIVLWNALALEQGVEKAVSAGTRINESDLEHILPTMTDHVNFVGRFDLDLERRPPFEFRLAQAAGSETRLL
ncbi:MAG: Tn3 family transposase [bacterium]